MRAECAWCGKHLGDKPGPDGAVTHGICNACREAVLADFHAKHNGGTDKRRLSLNVGAGSPSTCSGR
jgi:hypothetical protein